MYLIAAFDCKDNYFSLKHLTFRRANILIPLTALYNGITFEKER